MSMSTQTIDRDQIPGIVLLGDKASAKTSTLRSWLLASPLRQKIRPDGGLDELKVLRNEETEQVDEYLLEVAGVHIRVIDVPGEIMRDTAEDSEYEQQLDKRSGKVAGFLLFIEPYRDHGDGGGTVTESRLQAFEESAGKAPPTVHEAIDQALNRTLPVARNLLARKRVAMDSAKWAVQVSYADMAVFGSPAQNAELRRQYRDVCDEWFPELSTTVGHGTNDIRRRLEIYPRLAGLTAQAFPALFDGLTKRLGAFTPFIYAQSNKPVDGRLSHQDQLGLVYLWDAVIGRAKLSQEEARRRALDLARMREQKRLRQRLLALALVASVVALVVTNVVRPNLLPGGIGHSSCRVLALRGPQACRCLLTSPRNVAPTTLADRLPRYEAWAEKCEVNGVAALPEAARALARVHLAQALVHPYAFDCGAVARLHEQGVSLAIDAESPPFASTAEANAAAFVAAAATTGATTSIEALGGGLENQGLDDFVDMVKAAARTEACLGAWARGRADGNWAGIEGCSVARQFLPPATRALFDADVPTGSGASVTPAPATTGRPQRRCGDSLSSALFPMPAPDLLTQANVFAMTTTLTVARAIRPRLADLELGHRSLLRVLTSFDPDSPILLTEAELSAILTFLSRPWVRADTGQQVNRGRTDVMSRKPKISLARAVAVACQLVPELGSWPSFMPLAEDAPNLLRGRVALRLLELAPDGKEYAAERCRASGQLVALRGSGARLASKVLPGLRARLTSLAETEPVPALTTACMVEAQYGEVGDDETDSMIDRLSALRPYAVDSAKRCAVHGVMLGLARENWKVARARIEALAGLWTAPETDELEKLIAAWESSDDAALKPVLDGIAARYPEMARITIGEATR